MGKKRNLVVKEDDVTIEYKLMVQEDLRSRTLVVSCIEPVTDEEYAMSLISLGKDILSGEITADLTEQH